MGRANPEHPSDALIDKILGYLNFSSGNHDANFFRNLDEVFSQHSNPEQLLGELLNSADHRVARSNKRSNEETSIEQLLDKNDPFEVSAADQSESDCPAWRKVANVLTQRLDALEQDNETFRDPVQARTALSFVFDKFLIAWLSFHRDLLFHQRTEFTFNSFFVARAFELTLRLIDLPDEQRLAKALAQFNDFLGHRPIATLESQQIEAYPNEWIRPIPVYVAGVGAATGPYKTIVGMAVELIRGTHEDILHAAKFNPEFLNELAIDPRAFDFDHPINKRPNHHFGTWDEQQVGPDGYYRRFIIHQVTLDGLLTRVRDEVAKGEIARDELESEAAAVLACTMLMASAISGDCIGAWDSEVTLGTLLPVVADYRDRFYEMLLERLPEKHRQRLNQESLERHQPFGAARQALNSNLSARRASQLVNCRLASIFARMGFPVAAQMQLETVPVASARIVCRIDCLLAASFQAIEQRNLGGALKAASRMVELLKRGIGCGAIVDPWNIIGFDANYSLFPALQDSVRDHRAFELVDIVESIFALYSRLWSQAAAQDANEMVDLIRAEFQSVVTWWRKYAAHEVMSVDAVDPNEVFDAAKLVSTALNLWQKGGAEAGDIRFWAQHAELFDSPKAYKLVIDALLQREDYTTTTALLIHWLGQSSTVGLQQGASSFHDLMYLWIAEQKRLLLERCNDAENFVDCESVQDTWSQISKFYDFLEANADQYWSVPHFEIDRRVDTRGMEALGVEDEDQDDSGDIFEDLWKDVVYKDSTNDGIEGEIHDGGGGGDDIESDEALNAEIDRVLDRLEFLGNLASYWRIASTIPLAGQANRLRQGEVPSDHAMRLAARRDTILSWVRQADINRGRLLELLDSINAYKLPSTDGDQVSMVIYDQHRLFKESLLEQTINCCVETENAVRALRAVVVSIDYLLKDRSETPDFSSHNGLTPLIDTLSGFVMQNPRHVADRFDELVEYFENQPILYVPLTRGGDPRSIVDVRLVQSNMLEMLQTLPRIGMFEETCVLTETVLKMEQKHPVAMGAVTEFDELFKVAYTAMVEALADASAVDTETEDRESREKNLFACLKLLTESLLQLWLEHSKTLRLSVLEKVHDQQLWMALVKFIETYGDGLLTQYFLHLGNVRAILHQGVGNWIEQVENAGDTMGLKLFEDLNNGKISKPAVVAHLTMVLESVMENFTEYRDYNTTTTQSDHGDKIFILLDFLRLRSSYDRVRWKMKPVIWAHKILVDKKQNNVARMWRRELNEKISPKATRYIEELEELRKRYSIQLQSVGRRIEGRFESQIQIDRLIALVKPAVAKPRTRDSLKAFDLLQHEAQAFCRTTTGVGIELPPWLAALEQEVEQIHLPARLRLKSTAADWRCDALPDFGSLRRQLEEFPGNQSDSD
ncbi:hypothetical protein [Mariniblastus fucicola]|uniref:Uncharacterized protein n=1 Tax=Mariniblastus fucicola TaxID=980251 RepID=A0A5B9PBY5_9BACT|nr:hypothetical protein [Mariniblastus fucicola]QEG20673.1 hypothetical protein MFFC18_05230 [Mariniblastus fucicola]